MESNLRRYLSQQAEWMSTVRKDSQWKYSSIEDYVVKNGTLFTSAPLTSTELEIVYHAAGTGKFPIRQCFANSQKLLLNDYSDKLVYVEGYASAIIPVHHAWIAINNKVVDLTMRVYEVINGKIERKINLHNHRRFKDRVVGILPAGREYLGVPFGKEAVIDSMRKTKMYQSLIDNWQEHRPLLRGI